MQHEPDLRPVLEESGALLWPNESLPLLGGKFSGCENVERWHLGVPCDEMTYKSLWSEYTIGAARRREIFTVAGVAFAAPQVRRQTAEARHHHIWLRARPGPLHGIAVGAGIPPRCSHLPIEFLPTGRYGLE